jgi:hypothetical protein
MITLLPHPDTATPAGAWFWRSLAPAATTIASDLAGGAEDSVRFAWHAMLLRLTGRLALFAARMALPLLAQLLLYRLATGAIQRVGLGRS